MKIGILGTGALGTIIGSIINEAGYNVDLIDENWDHVNKLNESGAKLTGFLDVTIDVNAVHSTELKESYDIVFLLTKQVYTRKALTSILPFLHKQSVVCTLQNGVPEDLVSAIVGKERTVGGTVGFGATWIGPGVSKLTTEYAVMKKYGFEVGEQNGEITERIQTIKQVLESVGNCQITDNIFGIKWSKLLMNTTFSGMSAALGCTFGELLDNQTAMKGLANIADETIKVAKLQNISLDPMQGVDFEQLELESQSCIPDKLPVYRKVWSPHVNLKASMLQDLEKKQKTEIEFINGHVVEKGREIGFPTPFNNLVCKLVKDAESNREVPEFNKGLAEFETKLTQIEGASI